MGLHTACLSYLCSLTRQAMRFLILSFSKIPFWLLYLVADLTAVLLRVVLRYRLATVKEQIAACFPEYTEKERQQTVKAFYKNLADVTLETFKSFSISEEEVCKRMVLTNPGVLDAVKESEKSVIFMAAHQANWEWMLQGLSSQLSFPIDGVYKPLTNPTMEKIMRESRSRFGGEPIPKNDFLMTVMKRRGQFRAYALIADQVPLISNDKYWTTFLGRETAFQIGAETIARLTKFPAYFLNIRRVKRGYYTVTIEHLTDAPYPKEEWKLTEAYAKAAEQMITVAPQDWLWSHKRWKYARSMYEG